MFKYILEKDTKELAPLLEAAFCPYLLSFPGLCNMLLDLIRSQCREIAQVFHGCWFVALDLVGLSCFALSWYVDEAVLLGQHVGSVDFDGRDGGRDEEEEQAAERVGGGEHQERPPERHGCLARVRDGDGDGDGDGEVASERMRESVNGIGSECLPLCDYL